MANEFKAKNGIIAPYLQSTIGTGTAPFTIASTTLVTNLNVDYLDGQHGSYYTTAGNLTGTLPSSVLGSSTLYIGTTGITLNRASASQSLAGVSIDGSAARLSDSTNGFRSVSPGGGSFYSQSSLISGAALIRLPSTAYSTNTMLRMTIKIYEYTSGTQRTIELGGYYGGYGSWYNVFATQETQTGTDIVIRFGGDGTYPCIWIGETNTVWYYPQIFVTELQVGYNSTTDSVFGTGWNISFVSTFNTINTSTTASRQLHAGNYTSFSPSLSGSGATGTWSINVTGSAGSASSAGSATNIANGAANQIPYQTGSGSTSFISAPSVANTSLSWNGSAFTWAAGGGFTSTDDTSTNATYYPVIATTAGGSTAKTSSTKLTFNPSTGTLGATVFNSLSDATQKKNVVKIDNASKVINSIDGVEFDWKDNGKKSAGVIAQELEKILPWLVEETDGVKSVNYSGLIGYLIESNKEMQKRIEALESK